MAGQSRQSGDWVIQPETWTEPRSDPTDVYYINTGEVFVAPLTVSGDWYNTAGDQMERYREMEQSEVAVATRGDIWLHWVPQPEGTWLTALAQSVSSVCIARITRWKNDSQDQNDTLLPTVFSLREAAEANDPYVWQQMRHFTNVRVYDPVTVTSSVVNGPSLVQHIPVNARYKRKLEGQDNMVVMVEWGVFHLTQAWDMAQPYTTPTEWRLAITPYLRTFIV